MELNQIHVERDWEIFNKKLTLTLCSTTASLEAYLPCTCIGFLHLNYYPWWFDVGSVFYLYVYSPNHSAGKSQHESPTMIRPSSQGF